MSEANDVVDVAVGSVRMLDIDRDFVFRNFNARQQAAQSRSEYYAWADFLREALLTYASEEPT